VYRSMLSKKQKVLKKPEDYILESLELYKEIDHKKSVEEKKSVIFNPIAEFAKHIHLKKEEEEDINANDEIIKSKDIIKNEINNISSYENGGSNKVETERKEVPIIKKKDRKGNTRVSTSVTEENSSMFDTETIISPSTNVKTNKEVVEKKDHVEIIEEPIVGKGLAAALQFAQQKGFINQEDYGGRRKDKKILNQKGVLHEDDVDDSDIRIEYRDQYGRIMTPKQTYRFLSHKYHGEGPGKNKLEKERKRYLEELKRKQMSNIDTPLHTMEKLERVQKATNLPYVIVDKNNLSVLAAHTQSTTSSSSNATTSTITTISDKKRGKKRKKI
jgi:U4/U6.U5 tri-snRNP-associated protein 1